MRRRSTREARSAKHEHEFSVQNVGAALQRHVCGRCGHVSIDAIPPSDLRAEVLEVEAGLFKDSQASAHVDEEPVIGLPPFGERR